MSTIYNLDTANLFVGDDNPDESQFLVLKSVKVPSLEENTKDFQPGGGVAGISYGMRSIMPLVTTFTLEGINPKVMPYFMRTRRVPYTIRGNLTDVRTQADIPLVAVLHGRMIKVDVGEFAKQNGVESMYEIREVVKYELRIDGTEKVYFDFFAGPGGVRIDGETVFNDVARNIGIGV